MSSGKKYKIVYGFNEADYLPIDQDELHKAFLIAMEGGKAVFKNGFFQNRGNDIMRIVPDWHAVRGWNRGYKMTTDDFEDVRPLEESYRKTLNNGKMLAEYIVREDKRELLQKPASEAFKEIKQIAQPSKEAKLLADKMKIGKKG